MTVIWKGKGNGDSLRGFGEFKTYKRMHAEHEFKFDGSRHQSNRRRGAIKPTTPRSRRVTVKMHNELPAFAGDRIPDQG